MPLKYEKGDFTIDVDKNHLDFDVIHDFLANSSYWAQNRPRHIIEKSIENSLCYGVYHCDKQIGFARIITDYATFAYLLDVFILESYRGQGLSKWLMECILKNPEMQTVKKWMLATRDAHGLYAKFGFRALQNPEKMMELTVK